MFLFLYFNPQNDTVYFGAEKKLKKKENSKNIYEDLRTEK